MLQKNTVTASTLELLIALQNESELKNFYLAGGTSLSLQIGHRKSIDLDFFSLYDFDTSNLQEFLEDKYDFKTDYSSKNTLKGSIQNIKIDFICHKYQLVNPIIEKENTRLYSIKDIAAMKLNAIAGNGTRTKDFIDIYFILKNNSLFELLEAYKIKYSSRNILHVIKSLNYFEDIKTDDWPQMILEQNLKLNKIKKVISECIYLFSKDIKNIN